MFPVVNFNQGFVGLGNATLSGGGKNAFGFEDSVTHIRGRHTLKMGVEVIRRQENSNNMSQGGGTYTFSNLETAMPGNANTGNSVASFLLGVTDRGSTYMQAGGV
jgi:hypothetical protein